MTDWIIYSAAPHPRRRGRLITPTIVVVGTIVVGGLWTGHHQPEPVSCDPGSRPVAISQVVTPTINDPVICWPDKVRWTTPGYDLGKIGH